MPSTSRKGRVASLRSLGSSSQSSPKVNRRMREQDKASPGREPFPWVSLCYCAPVSQSGSVCLACAGWEIYHRLLQR